MILLKEEKDALPDDSDFKKAATSGEMEDEKKDEAEEEVAIIWRQEEKEETKPRAVVTSVSNTGRKMLCKVCDISFQGRPYSDYQASPIEHPVHT